MNTGVSLARLCNFFVIVTVFSNVCVAKIKIIDYSGVDQKAFTHVTD